MNTLFDVNNVDFKPLADKMRPTNLDEFYGQIDIVALVFFVTLTILCLAITVIIMQRRKSVK